MVLIQCWKAIIGNDKAFIMMLLEKNTIDNVARKHPEAWKRALTQRELERLAI